MSRAIPFRPENPTTESNAAAPPPGSHSWKSAGNGADEVPDFSAALVSAQGLQSLKLDKRPTLLGRWMKKGDLGYLFAPRGAGKSWMAMLIANAVAEGRELGEWERGEVSCPVFYFDAEMNLADVQDRAKLLGIESERFNFLSNERLYLAGGQGVNIASVAHQQGLSAMLPDGCFFIIDNLSTAQIGMRENDNDDFDLIRDWLMSLRHRGITVMIVHHAGRNGAMRGSSRREDPAHWVISLTDASDETSMVKAFVTDFTPPKGKARNCKAHEVPTLKWTLASDGERMGVRCEKFSGPEALLSHIQDGIGSANELASIMGVRPGTISKWCKKLFEQGKIVKAGRDYKAA